MQNAWHLGKMIGFDLETTGKDPTTARIVTASVVEMDTLTGHRRDIEWLAFPEVPITPEVTAIHGVSQKKAEEDGQDPDIVAGEIIATLNEAQARGIPIVTHNGQYDITILDRDSQRYGLPKLNTTLIMDTLVMDRHCDPDAPGEYRSRQLSSLAYYYDQEWTGDAHTSNADSVMAVKIAYQLAEWYPDELQIPFQEIRRKQSQWSDEWIYALRAKYAGKGYDTSNIKSGWPVIPGPPGVDQVDAVHSAPVNTLLSPDGSRVPESSLVQATNCGYPLPEGGHCARQTRPGLFCHQHC